MPPFRTRNLLVYELLLQLVLFGGRSAVADDESQCSCGVACSCDMQSHRQGNWFVADTENFQVCSLVSEEQAKRTACQCELLRGALTEKWNPKAKPWNPRCQVLLFPSQSNYVRAVGRGSEATLGSSLVRPNLGAVTSRRIDLRTDVENHLTAALPHELCHVVLADLFRTTPAPLWFDEGAALLCDPVAKQRLHERDLLRGLKRGAAFSMSELLSLEGYPPPERWDVFYGQSASLVRFLLAKGSYEDLVHTVKGSKHLGVTVAMQESYGFGSLAELAAQLSVANEPIALLTPAIEEPEQVVPASYAESLEVVVTP